MTTNASSLKYGKVFEEGSTSSVADIPAKTELREKTSVPVGLAHGVAACSGVDDGDVSHSASKTRGKNHDYVRDHCRPLSDAQLRRALEEKLG